MDTTDQFIIDESQDKKVRILYLSANRYAVEFQSRDRWARAPAVSNFGIALLTFARFCRQCN